jgi:hypothetical protein
MNRTLSDELNDLHAAYAAAVNRAAEVDDLVAAAALAAAYDDEAWELVAAWEDKTHLLRQLPRPSYDTPLRGLVRRLSQASAA